MLSLLVATVATATLVRATGSSDESTFQCAHPGNFCVAQDIILRCNASSVGTPGRCSANVSGQWPPGSIADCWESAEGAGDAACQKNCVVYADPPFTLAADKCTPSASPSPTPSNGNHPRSNVASTPEDVSGIMAIPEGTGIPQPVETGVFTIPEGTGVPGTSGIMTIPEGTGLPGASSSGSGSSIGSNSAPTPPASGSSGIGQPAESGVFTIPEGTGIPGISGTPGAPSPSSATPTSQPSAGPPSPSAPSSSSGPSTSSAPQSSSASQQPPGATVTAGASAKYPTMGAWAAAAVFAVAAAHHV